MARLSHPHAAKPKSAAAAPSAAPPSTPAPVSIIAVDTDSDHFVRGRVPSSKARPTASETPRPPAKESDSLFGVRAAPTAEKKRRATGEHAVALKRRKTSTPSSDELSTSSSSSSSSAAQHVDMLTYRHLYLGQTLLGSVRAITELELLLALPNGHTGHLALREISTPFQSLVDDFIAATPSTPTPGKRRPKKASTLPDLHSLFHVGQLLPASVLALTTPSGTKRIELTMRVEAVNAALTAKGLSAGMRLLTSVASVQERGYTVELGVSDAQMTGFLPFTDAPVHSINRGQKTRSAAEAVETKDGADEDDNGEEEEERLVVGQPVLCLVRSVSGRSVTLTADPAVLASHVSATSPSQHLESLVPSSLLSLTVKSVTPQGLLCASDTLRASVDLTHLPALPSSQSKLSLSYKPGSSLTACLLYFNRATKHCACSLNPRLLQGQSVPAARQGR